jgi:hypothetical protein
MLTSTLAALAVVLLVFTQSTTAALGQWTGTSASSPGSRAAALRALGILVFIGMLFALDPELRAVLFVMDAIGVDIFRGGSRVARGIRCLCPVAGCLWSIRDGRCMPRLNTRWLHSSLRD